MDTIRCELESAPKYFMFSSDGRFFYVLYEMKNVIEVYSYKEGERVPIVEKIQTISSTGSKPNQLTAACAMHFSPDEKHVFCSNAGDNTVSMYDRDDETGMLTLRFCLPISGDYPKDTRSSRTENISLLSTTREVFPSLRSTMKKGFSS